MLLKVFRGCEAYLVQKIGMVGEEEVFVIDETNIIVGIAEVV